MGKILRTFVLTAVFALSCIAIVACGGGTNKQSGNTDSDVEKTYTITWKNGETVLETDNVVKEGSMPVYNGVLPTKEATEDGTYSFSGWSPAITAVSADAVYTAQFTFVAYEKYTVNFVTDNNIPISTETVKKGEKVSRPASAPARDGYKYYEWTKDGDIYDFNESVTENTTLAVTYFKAVISPEEFMAMEENENYILEADIDFRGVTYTQIGAFNGVLDGNGYSLKNVTLSAGDGLNVQGLFGTLRGTVRNICIENFAINPAFDLMLGDFGILAEKCTGKLENVIIKGYVPKKTKGVTAWADYTSWDLHAGFVASNADGAYFKNILIDVTNDTEYDGSLVAARGSYTIDNLFIVRYENTPTDIGGNYVKKEGSVGALQTEELLINILSETLEENRYWEVDYESLSALKKGSAVDTSANVSYYSVKYYFENSLGEFVEDETLTAVFAGRNGETVKASPTVFEGYVFDENNENNLLETTLAANVILKVYYKARTSVHVTIKDSNGNEIFSGNSPYNQLFDTSVINYTDGYDVAALYDGNKSFKASATPLKDDVTLTAVMYKGIRTTDDFMAISGDKRYILLNDIDFTDVNYSQINSFSGTLEGNGYAVKNVTMQAVAKGCGEGAGLFKTLSGTLQNIKFENIVINATDGGDCGGAGLIASYFTGVVDKVYITGTMHGTCKTTTPTSNGVEAAGTWAGACFGYSSESAKLKAIITDIAVDEGNNIFLVSGLAWHTSANYVFCVQNANNSSKNFGAGAVDFVSGDSWGGLASMAGMISHIAYAFRGDAWIVNNIDNTVESVGGYLI
ncbi:MAG: InlB B-repeat-containing protein [Clostridia bacterium]|nr:InlB B-repeat-containing protein [Clostridia bacterium]